MVGEVRIEVLGPLRVLRDGAEQRPGGRRERAVLALLIAHQGRPVAADRMVEEIWGEDPPPSAPGSLQVAVSKLRTTLDPTRQAGSNSSAITLGPAGYELSGVTVDAEELTAAANGNAAGAPADVAARTDEALRLWRGEAYADLQDVPSLAVEAARLGEDRLRLVETRAAALLDLGRHDEAQAMLSPLVVGHPFRERLWSLLALALYRCDRQAEALETIRRLRTALVEELGVDPSPSVRTLEADVLAQAAHLDAPVAPAASTTPGDATRAHGSGVVGRADALATIDAELDHLLDARMGGALVITGEAGIGKTMLATELGARARRRGARVVVGRCHEADLSPAYWPWLPVLRALAGSAAPAEVSALIGERSEPVPEVVSADAAALRTYDAAARVLGSHEEPLVVVLEDLHWSDTSSLRLLAYAAEALRERPVLLVVTVRDVDPRARPALTQALAALTRLGAVRLRVPPLSGEAVEELLVDVLDEPAPGLADLLWRRTDGNPFFVIEMARLLAATGGASMDHAARLDVPDGIADVLRLRLLQLSESSREALAAASVLGREFDAETLGAALGRPALDDLDEALGPGVLASGSEPGRYRFVHALTRETAYADLPPGQRARWHATSGAALAEQLSRNPDLVSEVAHHCRQAAAYLPDQVAPAVSYGTAAAVAAEERGAFEEAATLWARAVEIERRAPEPDPARRHRLLLGLARARQRLGDTAGMKASLDEAVELARRDGDHRRMAEAATSFRNSGVWHWREMGTFDEATVAVLKTCLDHVDDLGLRARAHANLGLEYYAAWRSAESGAYGEKSLELARASGDLEVLRDCLQARTVALWIPGHAGQREERARELLSLPLGAEDEISAHIQLGTAVYHQGRGPEADEIIGIAQRRAARLGHTGTDIPLAWWKWLRAVDTLSPDADELARTALSLHRRSTVVGLSELTGLVTFVGTPDRSPVPADVVAVAEDHPNRFYRAVVAHAVARSGDHDTARRLLGEQPPPGEYDYASLFAGCMRVDGLAEMGDVDLLPAALEAVLPYADEVAAYGSVVAGGSAAFYVGQGLMALGEVDRAAQFLEQAIEANVRAGSRRWELAARQALQNARLR